MPGVRLKPPNDQGVYKHLAPLKWKLPHSRIYSRDNDMAGLLNPMYGKLYKPEQLVKRYPAIMKLLKIWEPGKWCPGKAYYLGRCIGCGLIGRAQPAVFSTVPHGATEQYVNFRCYKCAGERREELLKRSFDQLRAELKEANKRIAMLNQELNKYKPTDWSEANYNKKVALKQREKLTSLDGYLGNIDA